MTEKPDECTVCPSSFRDPSGTVYHKGGKLLRQVDRSYSGHYDLLMGSGLYERLVREGLLVPHEEADPGLALSQGAHRVIMPEKVGFISYPYEWCFSQLKDAALCTIRIQKTGMEYGMSLKDASAYNIQSIKGRPVLIDTLSFEKYAEGEPWVAYMQFCQHFLAPLALIAYKDARLSQLSKAFIDGIPLDLASRLLPWRTLANPGLLIHIHLHAMSQNHFKDKTAAGKGRTMSRKSVMGLADSLESTIKGLRWKPQKSGWSGYYGGTNYGPQAMECKKRLVREYLEASKPKTVWDLGSNTGEFSRLATSLGASVVSMDQDPSCVEKNYLEAKSKGAEMLPLVMDLANPSPGIGWENAERRSLIERGPADAVLALAIIHHLALSGNLPLGKIADFLRGIGDSLIIEFVPKTDSQAKRLLAMKGDIFPGYTKESFEEEFGKRFRIAESAKVEGSERTLYLMRRKRDEG